MHKKTLSKLKLLAFARALQPKGEEEEFMDWCRVSSAFLYGNGIIEAPLFVIHMLSYICLWFVCSLAKETQREAFISQRSQVNVFDTLKAFIRISPLLARRVFTYEKVPVFHNPISLSPYCNPKPSNSLWLSSSSCHAEEAIEKAFENLKHRFVSVQEYDLDFFQKDKDDTESEGSVKASQESEECNSLRDLFKSKSRQWPPHFPSLPPPALTFQRLHNLNPMLNSKHELEKSDSTFHNKSLDEDSGLQIRQLEDKLHVQLLLPKICDTDTLPIYSAQFLNRCKPF